jgi:type IV pilus assembly protein PilF
MTHPRLSLILVILLTVAMAIAGCATTGITPENRKKAKAGRNLAEAYLSEGNDTAALRELLKAKELNPEDPIIYNDLGLVYRTKDKLDLAVAQFEKAIQLRPDYSLAKNNLGAVYLIQKKWDKAIVVLSDVTGDMLYGTPHYPLANLGWAYYNKGEFAKASKYLEEALSLSPDFFVAQLNLGKTYLAQGKLNEARQILEKAAQKNPKNPALLLEMGRTYRLLGDYNSAVLALKGAMELSEDATIAVAASEELKKIHR